MPNWGGLVLTDRGKNLQAKVEAGATLNFTKVKFGDGVVSGGQTLEKLLDLVSPKQTVVISSVEAKENGICEIISVLSNTSVTQGYYLREMGLFATDPSIGEILFAVSADTAPDYLVAGGGSVVISEAFSINLIVGNAANITAVIDPKGLVTVGTMTLAINTHNDDSNAHAAAIGKHNTDYNAHSTALNFWQKSKVYTVGSMIYPKVHGSQYCFVCTQAGTSAAAEPAWVYTDNTVVTDNACKWTVSRIAAMRDFVFTTTATALVSGGKGVVGSANTYARGDHTHTLPAYPTALPADGGNASTAAKLQTARTIALSGKVTGTATSFDGSGNISIPVTAVVADSCTGNAATATTATADSDGNTINATYVKTATFADNVISALAYKTLSSLGVAYSMGSTGYVAFGPLFGGLIIQWGYYKGSLDDGTTIIRIPVAFKNNNYVVSVTADGGVGAFPSDSFVVGSAQRINVSEFRLNGYGEKVTTIGYYWFALGQ